MAGGMTGRDGQSLRKKGALRERGIGGEGGRAGLGERMERSVGAAASGEERGGQEDDVARWGAGGSRLGGGYWVKAKSSTIKNMICYLPCHQFPPSLTMRWMSATGCAFSKCEQLIITPFELQQPERDDAF